MDAIRIPQELVPKMIADAFYARMTDRIYLMNFKPKLMRAFNLTCFSNAGLKITEALHKEDLVRPICRTDPATLSHFGNCELPGSFIVALRYHISLFCPEISTYDWVANSLIPRNENPDSEGLRDSGGGK